MLFFTLLSVFVLCGASDVVEVTTSLGKIRGNRLKSRLGNDFYSFRGIRYAKSPVGELRFRNPEPIEAWYPNIFDATEDGPMCPQVTENVSDLSEDCLRLNVYTKDLKGRKPVIFFIHAGGFYSVSGQSTLAGPQHLMDRDIVLVTINYRLGSLGFTATGTADAPGNMGLKDQVIAMRWVQAHIEKFGGDSNSVTLLGYSAGSLSIGLHMMSPMSKGLFHRGIGMSASPFGQWTYPNNDIRLAERQAKLLSCPTTTPKELIACLREKSMMDFVNTTSAMFEFSWNPILNWYPVIEEDFGQERFLIENPFETIQSGKFYKVPLITGITEFELTPAAYYTLINDTARDMYNKEFEKYAPIAFLYERNTPRSKEISATLRNEYLKNASLTYPESLVPFGELYSDSVIGYEYHRFLQLISQHTPVYTYLFKYKGRYSHFTMPGNVVYGAVHHDELLYLFHVSVLTPIFKQTDPEDEVIQRLTRLWTEFAIKGDPNNREDEYLKDLEWNLYSQDRKPYLEIGNDKLVIKEGGIFPDRFRIWDNLFPLPKF